MTTVAFLDTNIYLHYQDIDQLDWLGILGDAAIVIVIPPINVRELNKHKELQSRPKIKRRAEVVIGKLYSLFENSLTAQIRGNIDVVLEGRDPIIDFRHFQLSPEVQDDQLIASVLMYRNENPQVRLILVTSDMGLILKAKASRLGISTLTLDDTFKLPDEPDAEQLRIRALEQELREFKNRLPVLSLIFSAGKSQIEFTLEQPLKLTQDIIDQKTEEIRQQYPFMTVRGATEENKSPFGLMETIAQAQLSIFGSITTAQIESYNAELETFYKEYVAYLEEDLQYQNLKRRTCILNINLVNTGTSPAEDIDLFLHFPDGFQLVDGLEFPGIPEPPEPPERPMTEMERLSRSMGQNYIVPPLNAFRAPPHSPPPPNVSRSNIKRTNSYDVDLNVRYLKHGRAEELDPFCVVFDSVDAASSFQIDYELHSATLPNSTSRQLHVIIRKG